MSANISVIYFIINVFSYICVVRTVVPEYCLEPFNRSDCGLKPIPVMTYWKPGSRCEVDVWRGCPTNNKFENEYECSLMCIFRMSVPTENVTEKVNECEAEFNEGNCTDVEETVYTYVNGTCVKKTWQGCDTLNKFKDEMDCENACVEGGWKAKLEELSIEDLKSIVDIIDEVAKTEEPTEEPTTVESTTAETTTEESEESEEAETTTVAEDSDSDDRESEQHIDNV